METFRIVELWLLGIGGVLVVGLAAALYRTRRQAGASQQQFRTFIENSPVAVFIKDAAGRYVFANREAEKAIGTSAWHLKTDTELMPAEAAARIVAHDRAVMESGSPESYDLVVNRPEGARRYHSTKFPLGEAGGPRYVGAVTLDVTQQARSEEQLQLVTDAMSVAVIRCSADVRVLWANRIFCEWLKCEPRALVGRPLEEVFGADSMPEIRPYIERALRGEPVRYERLVHYPGLGTRWVAAAYTPTADGGWVAVVHDIDERRRMEEALKEADRRKDQFLATLGHELRNPLAPIRNAVAILARKGSPAPEAVWSRDLIERQVEHMTRLLEDLLDISRISSGKLTVRRERIRLGRALEMALETSRPNLDAAGMRVEARIADEALFVDADETRLAQVFANLLNNAAKFGERGGRVRLEARRDGAEAVVLVADGGIGFPPEMAGQLFEPFVQVASGRAGGLGIGLALARGIVGLHGGTITAKSAGAGRGSEFVVRLPAAATAVPAPEAAGAQPARQAARAMRVLVADDNRDAADSLARILQMYGHDVRVVYDGAEAIAMGESFRPAAAVLDIGMPGTNGYEVARALRRRLGVEVRLIALTGWGQAADRARALEAGFDHHLTKPTDPAEVHGLLEAAGV